MRKSTAKVCIINQISLKSAIFFKEQKIKKIIQQTDEFDGVQVTKIVVSRILIAFVKRCCNARTHTHRCYQHAGFAHGNCQPILDSALNLNCIQLEIVIYDIKNKAQLELNGLLVNLSDFLQTYFYSIYLTSAFSQCIINFPKITINFYDIITSNLFYHPCIDRQYNIFCMFWSFLSRFIGFKIVLIHFNFDVHFLKFSHY